IKAFSANQWPLFQAHRDGGLGPEMSSMQSVRSFAMGILQFIAGIVLVAGLTVLIRQVPHDRDLPPGWSIIRPPHEVSALALQGDVVWAGGKDGLMAIDRPTGRLLPLPTGLPEMKYVSDLLIGTGGDLWIAHSAGVSRCVGGVRETCSREEGFPPGPAMSLLEDREGAIWAGTEQGVFRYDGRTWHPLTTDKGAGSGPVDVLYQDRDGIIWLGSSSPTQGSLASFDGKVWRPYTSRDGLAHNSVNAILQDHHGAIWFATGFGSRGGATRLADGTWTSLTRGDGLAGEKVRSIFEDCDGCLWFGSEYDGIAVSNGTTWRVFTPGDGLSGWEVKEMLQDSDGIYWLGTEDGVTRITPSGMPQSRKES
ncbi:MAG TPA: two-component regulator propeller domain-containing protein, partial [Syntrophobacteraceae bacterium]|nr:two-component regulator propeller domain-containing protein [Syntrophobacteraceae bacterium]